MLRLKNLKKSYHVAGADIEVLKGMNVSFRKNEFVSILGPSGCGKTTTLNIIGGLDTYNSGDLIIEGKSTKDYKDHDWDIYRNQSIGFIFQSYNLIPHQTILGNVELALTISGISKEVRQAKAKAALDKVGLSGQYNKRPNQLSGGQCQRVAIARALVNEPQILLADEPTGALDTKTSIQIMELIKDIAKERLVIMVTHNPELAEKYSTRIINLLDGEITSDSNPFTEEDEIAEVKLLTADEKFRKGKAKMSWWTSFKLSSRNLWTKRRRTIMTSIAGSIGIIGISAVLAVSTGVRGYIASTEDDMLSGNPVTITQTAIDITSLMSGMSSSEKVEFLNEVDTANVDSVMKYFIDRYIKSSIVTSNNISKDYINYLLQMNEEYYSSIMLNYGIDMESSIYTDYTEADGNHKTTSITGIKSTYTTILATQPSVSQYASMITSLETTFRQAPSDEKYIKSQYDILEGKIATEKNEIMLVLDSDSAVSDLVLAELGYYNQNDFIGNLTKYMNDEEGVNFLQSISYNDLMTRTFTWHSNDVMYNIDEATDSIKYNPYVDSDGLELKVVGILKPKADLNYGCLSNGFYYTSALTEEIIKTNLESEIVNYYKTKGTSSHPISYDLVAKYLANDVVVPIPVFNYPMGSSGNMLSSMLGGGGNNSPEVSLNALGGSDVASSISIYPVNFDQKDNVLKYLDAWNDNNIEILDVDGNAITNREKITYTDTLGLVMTIIDSIVNIVTIALVAFTALSLVVSCVMIAIITYISVVERVKEIGVIRSLGGRKKDVNNLFNAETLIIGICSGTFGVLFTYLLELIVNAALHGVVGVNIMNLEIGTALIMILLSIVLTVLSGLVPASKASRQNPVEALRTE